MDAILKLIDNAGVFIVAYFILTAIWSVFIVISRYKKSKMDIADSIGASYRPRIRPFSKAQLKIIHDMPHPDEIKQNGAVDIAA